jgi:hypothetical protein
MHQVAENADPFTETAAKHLATSRDLEDGQDRSMNV